MLGGCGCGFALVRHYREPGVIRRLALNKSNLGRWNEAPVSLEFLDGTDF